MANTTRQVELWKPGDAITSVRLNEMAEAINFLLKTSGYIFNRVALANYHATESSGSDFDYPGIIQEVQISMSAVSPHINAGRLVLPASAGSPLTEVIYSSTASAPYIENNQLFLNLASDASATQFPGAISGLSLYDPSDPSALASPGIFNGVIKIPRGVEEAYYSESVSKPKIELGKLFLPLAQSTESAGYYVDRTGGIAGLRFYDPSDPSAPASPGILNGIINLPSSSAAGVSSVRYGYTGASTPAPGVDGWVQTLYLWGLYSGNLDHTYATRQLMRVNGSVLEVVQQITYDDGNTWTESSA